MRFYLLYKNHGLYEPVLDDTEDTYVPIEPEDIRLNKAEYETIQKTEFRPIATTDKNGSAKKPLQASVLENKIKTKANLHDALLETSEGVLPEPAKFKLPISDEYDPEGKNTSKLQLLYSKKIEAVDLKTVMEKVKHDAIHLNYNTENARDNISNMELKPGIGNEMTKKESQYSPNFKDHMQLKNLKETASRIVGDSIDKAVSLAKEIKQEIDIELAKTKTLKSESSIKKVLTATEKKEHHMFDTKIKTNGQKDEVANDQERENFNIAEEIKKFESFEASMDSKANLKERQLLAQRDMEETIEEGTVRRRSELFTQEMSQHFIKKTDYSSENLRTTTQSDQHSDKRLSASNINQNYIYDRTTNIENDVKKLEHAAFTLGAQTVQRIRQAFELSYNSNLVLKTFFLQLTKIMVALSKFLFSKQTIGVTSHHDRVNKYGIDEYKYEERKETSRYAEGNINDMEGNKEIDDNLNSSEGHGFYSHRKNSKGEIIKKGKLSGAKIAQIEGNKPAELTDKMDIVISELLSKSVGSVDDRSDNEEFFCISKLHEPNNKHNNEIGKQDQFFDQSNKHFDRRKLLNILDEKSKAMEIKEIISKKYTSEHRSTTHANKNGNVIYYVAFVEARHFPNFEEIRKTKSLYEHEIKTELKNDKDLVYIAIVEAHVYTNKEAIFEEQANKNLLNNREEAIKIDSKTLLSADNAVVEHLIPMTVSPLPNKVIKYARSATDMEQISKKLAVQNIIHAIEPLLQFHKVHVDKRAKATIEPPKKTIVETTDVNTEEQVFFSQQSEKLHEHFKVAETRHLANIDVLELNATEIVVTYPQEHLQEHTEVLLINKQQNKSILESVPLPALPFYVVAEVLMNSINGPKEGLLRILDIKKERCNILFEQCKSYITSLEIPLDNNRDLELLRTELKMPSSSLEDIFLAVATCLSIVLAGPAENTYTFLKVVTSQAKPAIEMPYATVPEILNLFLEGPKDYSFDVPKVVQEKCNASFNAYLSLIKSTVTYLDQVDVLELPKTNLKYPNISIENIMFSVAVVLIIFLHGPDYAEFKIPEISTDTGNINYEEANAYSISNVFLQESKEDFEIPEITQKIPQTAMENCMYAPETMIVQFEGPKEGYALIINPKEAKSIPIINYYKSIELLQVLPNEQIVENLQIPQIVKQKPRVSLEDVYLHIAKVMEVFCEEPSSNVGLDLSTTKDQKARIDIQELKAVETTVIKLEEPKINDIKTQVLQSKQTERSIEKCSRSVAEVGMVSTNEIETEISFVEVPSEKYVSVAFESITPVAETIVTTVEETFDVNQSSKVMSKSANTSIVKSSATAIADITVKDVNVLMEIPKLKKTTIEDIEIEAHLKLPTTVDDSLNEITAEYSVEFPQEIEENVYAEFEFSNKKMDIEISSQIYESIRLMKKQAFQKQSMEATLSLAKELQTKIDMVEFEALEEEFIRSGSISSSSSVVTSPLSPLLEEYFFSIQGPSLMSRYRYFQDVFEEASLKLKSKIQSSTIQNFDASLTLVLQDVAMANLETDLNSIEVIEIDDYEDLKKLHFSTALLVGSEKQSMSSEVQSLIDMHSSSILQSNHGYGLSMDSTNLTQFAQTNIDEGKHASHATVLSSQEINRQNMDMALLSRSVKCAEMKTSATEMSDSSMETEIGIEMGVNVLDPSKIRKTKDDLEVQSSSRKQLQDIKKFETTVIGSSNYCLEKNQMQSGITETSLRSSGNNISKSEIDLAIDTTAESDLKLMHNIQKSSEISMNANSKSLREIIKRADKEIKGETPSPPVLPPTPLSDEYVFRLQAKMPEPSEYVPRDCSMSPESDREDIILRGGLIPHIRTTIERILYSPPLPSPPNSPDKTIPIYSKTGGGSGFFKFLS